MGLNLLRLRQRHAAHIAVALAISVSTIPVVLGALAQPVAAATSSNSTIGAQPVLAVTECDIAWVDWDIAYVERPNNNPAPSCTPDPVQVQQAFSNFEYNLCLAELHADGGHGICTPPPT